MIRDFTDLHAWQEAHTLVLLVYKVTKRFPTDERFGLTSQLRRAVVSVSSNIAEGFGRNTAKDKKQFYFMARTSLVEVHNQMLIASDLDYIDNETFSMFLDKKETVGKLVSGLIKSASAH